MTDSDDLTLLLLFKDQQQFTIGFPLAAQSSTIKNHKEIADSTSSSKKSINNYKPTIQLNMFHAAPAEVKIPIASSIPDNSCIWGWWRKPWEHNDHLLEKFKKLCNSGHKPEVLLYSQYSRKVYKAKLYDIYFVNNASCVEIPINWFTKCPEYYSTDAHRCGAFFALKIDEPKKTTTGAYSASEIFKDYRVTLPPKTEPLVIRVPAC